MGACVGGGNLTFTFLTNPPVTKTYFTARLDSALAPPPGPKNLLFTISLLLLQRRKWAGRVGETPRGQRGHKGAVFFYYLRKPGKAASEEGWKTERERERVMEEKATLGISWPAAP